MDYDIIIENVDFPTKTAVDRVTATSTAGNVNTNDTITTAATMDLLLVIR